MKIYISEHHSLDRNMLAAAFDTVTEPADADWWLCWKTIPAQAKLERVVLCQPEPPVAGARREMYPQHGKMHTVIRFDPQLPNEFTFSDTAFFPYPPWMFRRTIITDKRYAQSRGVYFAGRTGKNFDRLGYDTIYKLRADIAEALRRNLGGTCRGIGWPESTKNAGKGWHAAKMDEIELENSRYVLAIENCRMPGYVSEKLWDGLLSDRVTLYLGAPGIDGLVDPAAYVDLSRWVDRWTFDADGCTEYLMTLDHLAMRAAARDVLDGVGDKPKQEKTRCTQFVIDRIKETDNVS